MAKTKGLNVEFVNPEIAAAAHETMEAVMQATEKTSTLETAGVEPGKVSEDRYWERRCHKAEEELQGIARHLEHVNGILSERESKIVSLEHDMRIMQAQLDMVHLIFGGR